MKLNYVTLAIFVVFLVFVGVWVVHQPLTPMRLVGIVIPLPCGLLLWWLMCNWPNTVTSYLLQQIQLLAHRDREPDGRLICQAGGFMDILLPRRVTW